MFGSLEIGRPPIHLNHHPSHFLQNIETDTSPVFPENVSLPGQRDEITSELYEPSISSTIVTLYGVDTPRGSFECEFGYGMRSHVLFTRYESLVNGP